MTRAVLALGALALAVNGQGWALVVWLWDREPLVVALPVMLAGMVVVAILWPQRPSRIIEIRHVVEHHHVIEHRHRHEVHATVRPSYHGPAALAPAPNVIEGQVIES